MDDINPDFALQKLIFAYTKAKNRSIFVCVFAFDSLCANIVSTTTEPLIGQMRLAWWRDVIGKPPDMRPKGHPFMELFGHLPEDCSKEGLIDILNCWEEYLVGEEPHKLLEGFAQKKSYAMADMLLQPGQNDKALHDGDNCRTALQIYSIWHILRRTAIMRDDNGYDMLLDRTYERATDLLAAPKAQKNQWNMPKPIKTWLRVITHDLKKKNRGKPLLRPATALLIIFYGLIG